MYNTNLYMPFGRQGIPQQTVPGWQYQPTTSPLYQAQPYDNLRSVSGIEGAKSLASVMPPNSKDVAFDADEDIAYIITTDAGGFPTIKDYDMFLRRHESEPAAAPAAEYATKADIEALREEINAMKRTSASGNARTSGKKAVNDGE